MDTQSEDDIENPNSQNEKNTRRRKRKFYNLIREQMEFYFGDANLLKDRFLMQLIKNDPFVPLEIFLKFNKMKKITNCIDDISKSLSNSKLLELNDDKTKVRRITELQNNQNDTDLRTIYVEGIPSTADHDSLSKIFSHISGGKVVYVSLPKYKKTHKIKEFGFIEFENELCVEKCLKAFQLFNGVLGTQNYDPSELTSIKTFIKEQNDEIENSDEKTKNEKQEEKSQSESDSVDSTSEPVSKRPKLLQNNLTDENIVKKNDKLDDIKCKINEKDDNKNDNVVSTTDADDGETENENTNEETTKIRKRKKNKMHKTIKKELLNTELNVQQLKILQKKEWKRLRNKYLNMQREIIAELKRKNWEKNGGQQQQQKNNLKSKYSKLPATTASSTKSLALTQQTTATTQNQIKKFEIIKSPHHMNFYMVNKEIDGNTDDDDNNNHEKLKKSLQESITKHKKSNDNLQLTKLKSKNESIRNLADEKTPLFKYESGIIVNIRFLEPCLELKNFKSDMKQYDFVKYVDIKEGALEAFIRCESNKFAQQLCKKIQSAEYNCKILIGDAEKLYWSKIMQDREMKLNKTVKIKTKRGREKIPKIIANHIRFDDDE